MTRVALFVFDSGLTICGSCFAATLLRLDDRLDWTLGAGLLATAQILAVSLVSGIGLHRFTPGAVTVLTLGTTLALACALAVRRSRPPSMPSLSLIRSLATWQALLCLAAAAALAWRLFIAVVLPPFAYDALAYHLTAVASWVQSHHIGVNPYAFCCGHYPSNAEVLFAWPTLLLHDDALTQTVQIGTAILGALATGGLARFLGASDAGAITAGALFVLCPIVLTQANVNYNDVTVAAFLLAAIYFAARFFVSGRHAHLLVAGVALGLLLGTKIDAGAMVVVLLILLVVLLVMRRPRTAAAVRAGALVVAPLLLLGGWWYARNWVRNGNPIWPIRVPGLFAGPRSAHSYLTVPPGGGRNVLVEIARSWYHDLVFWTRRDYSYETRDGGLGPLWGWVGWWASVFLAVWRVRARRWSALIVLAPLAVIFAVEPYRWWSRFTIYLAAVGAIGAVIVLERLAPGRLRRVLTAAVVVLTLAGTARATWWLEPAGRAADLDMAQIVRVAFQSPQPRSVGSLFFPEYRWLDGVPRHATIGVETNAISIRFLYPLFGSHLDRHVVQFLSATPEHVDERLRGPGQAYLFVEADGRYAHWAARQPSYTLVSRQRGTAVYRRRPR